MMSIRVTYIGPEPYPSDRITACADALSREVPDLPAVRLVFAADFEGAVRQYIRRRSPEDIYTATRSSVQAVAKVLEQDDGTIIVVANAGGLRAALDFERVLAHEGLHVRAKQTAQDTARIRELTGATGAFADYLAMAGMALEEFRVERSLCERHWWSDIGYRETLGQALDRLRSQFRDAVVLRFPGEPVDRCRNTSIAAFYEMTTYMAYVQAEELTSTAERTLPDLPLGSTWDRLVGPFWERVRDLLEPIPGMYERLTRDTLEGICRSLGRVYQDWFSHIGFEQRDVPEGIYFDVLRHDF